MKVWARRVVGNKGWNIQFGNEEDSGSPARTRGDHNTEPPLLGAAKRPIATGSTRLGALSGGLSLRDEE